LDQPLHSSACFADVTPARFILSFLGQSQVPYIAISCWKELISHQTAQCYQIKLKCAFWLNLGIRKFWTLNDCSTGSNRPSLFIFSGPLFGCVNFHAWLGYGLLAQCIRLAQYKELNIIPSTVLTCDTTTPSSAFNKQTSVVSDATVSSCNTVNRTKLKITVLVVIIRCNIKLDHELMQGLTRYTKAQLSLGGADCSCLCPKASKCERSFLLTYTNCDIT